MKSERKVCQQKEDLKNFLESAIKKAKNFGADHVDLMLTESEVISASTRLTKLEKVEQADIEKINFGEGVGGSSGEVCWDNSIKFM